MTEKKSAFEKRLIVGPFQCNCRLIVCPETREAALIDPGDEAPRLLAELARDPSLKVKYLFHTHGHLDHVGATRAVKEGLAAAAPQIALHQGDEELYRALKMQGALFGFEYEDPLAIDLYLENEQTLAVGKLKLSVIHTPGHSPGSVSLRLHEDTALGVAESIYSGDTLFQGSVGRTDLWGADQDQMFRSIRTRLLTLDGDSRVCPGHGPDSTIGVEKRTNPFLS